MLRAAPRIVPGERFLGPMRASGPRNDKERRVGVGDWRTETGVRWKRKRSDGFGTERAIAKPLERFLTGRGGSE